MKKAIITGANGFVGSAVINELLNNGIEVLALGRKSIDEVNKKHLTQPKKFTYLQIDLAEIESLPAKIKKIGWTPGAFCVFYNFAWLGKNGLTDGTIKDQLKNVTYSAKGIAIAKEIGCMKFVNAGSMEETFVEKYIESGWPNQEYHSGQGIYAIAKLGSRDMCRLNAYLHKIDYVHTRFSVYVDDQLSSNSFIHKILKKIKNGETYDAPKNDQLFDILKLEEAARAYRLIGEKGINKSDYFIGTGHPKTLSQYFDQCKNIVGDLDHYDDLEFFNNKLLSSADFSIDDLTRDTGFKSDITFNKFIKEMLK